MGYRVPTREEEFVTDWALKWAEGTILGFVRGGIDLTRAVGMLGRAAEMIGSHKLFAIIRNIEENPVYLPYMSQKDKVTKIKPLVEALKKRLVVKPVQNPNER